MISLFSSVIIWQVVPWFFHRYPSGSQDVSPGVQELQRTRIIMLTAIANKNVRSNPAVGTSVLIFAGANIVIMLWLAITSMPRG